ncbi:MAG: ATP-binding protein, partial [bacterium]|nr:ATP-binding protein [bacterium]
MAKLNVEYTRSALQNFDFRRLFVEELGWSNPTDTRSIPHTIKDVAFLRKAIAELSGVVVFEITTPDCAIPDSKFRVIIAREIQKLHFENVLIFVDQERTKSIWYWLKQQDGKTIPREHVYIKGQPGDLFISKISALVFDISEFDEEGNVPIVEVAGRIKNALDIERVTKRFFKEYQDEYFRFCDVIQGIDDDRERHWYASVILNRLMFIYFLQRKLFLDDGNEHYLSDRFTYCQQQFGSNAYYGEFLTPLFFEGFGKTEQERSPEIRQLLGEITYLNGGLFLPHKIEDRYPDILIPDSAFEQLFDLFNGYSWTLDDTPGGRDNEINPDVLGYIFEKYINQKEFGAYYTRTEITEYLCEQTIYKLVLDEVNCPNLPNVTFGGKTYNWSVNFSSISELLLNLDADLCKKLLDVLPTFSLLDPACGSGAFLVAAMKTLINLYSGVVGKIEFLNDSDLSAWLRKVKAEHPSISYYIKKQIITNNLYGVDIMEEATEIAKLRLFLALVASAQRVEDLEPLPNIDFNILPGNSLIGLMRVDDEKFAQTATLFRKSYRVIVDEKARMINNYKHATSYTDDLKSLRDAIDQQRADASESLNDMLLDEFNDLKIKYEQVTWNTEKNKPGKSQKRALRKSDIEVLRPFHWSFEFDRIFRKKDGFDAIITNPPWEIFKPNGKEFFTQFSDTVSKKNMTIKEFKKEQAKLLKDENVLAAWLDYQSGYPHVSKYFRSAAQYENQIAIVNGKKAGTDINYYKLFLEQCYNLLKQGGYCGIIIPSGIYTDLGTKQLRELLFSQTRVNQLFGLSNEKFIFESVHHAFKFCLLSFEKSGVTQEFEAAFRINPREAVRAEELEFFLHNHSEHVTILTSLIRELSLDSLSVLEFKDKKDIRILEKMSQFPSLNEHVQGIWNLEFSREFDMTNASHLFTTEKADTSFPLIQGNMFHQFIYDYASPKYWINATEGKKKLLGKNTTDEGQKLAYQNYRLVHRRIASSTNERSLLACVLPPNSFCADTAQSVRNILPYNVTLFITAMFNSFVLDFQIRQRITAHLDMHFMYTLKLPRLTANDAFFCEIVERSAKLTCTTDEFADLWNEVMDTSWTPECGAIDDAERNQLRTELDGMIANIYG